MAKSEYFSMPILDIYDIYELGLVRFVRLRMIYNSAISSCEKAQWMAVAWTDSGQKWCHCCQL